MPGQGAPGRLGAVFVTIFLDLLGFGLIIPTAPYYALRFDASESEVAFLGTAFSLMQLITLPLWGRLSDRVGRKPVLMAGTLGNAAALALFGWAPSFAWLFAARMASGVMTGNLAAAQAYIADVTTGAERAKGMGLVGAAFGLGFILGPFCGGQLAELGAATGIGIGLVGYGAGALSLLNFVLVAVMLPESRTAEVRARDARQRAAATGRWDAFRAALGVVGLGALFLVFFVATFGFANMEWTFALLTVERLDWTEAAGGARYNGYVFGLVGVISAVTQGVLVGRLSKRFGERALVRAGLVLLMAGFVVLAAIDSVGMLIAACVLISIGNSLCVPSLSALVSRAAPASMQGSILGVQQSLGALGRVLGPTTGGLLFQYAGSPWPFLVGAGAFVAALGVAMTRVRPAPEEHGT